MTSRHAFHMTALLLWLLGIFSMTGCASIYASKKTTALPDLEIVYQLTTHYSEDVVELIGFVDPTGNVSLKQDSWSEHGGVAYPVFTSDNRWCIMQDISPRKKLYALYKDGTVAQFSDDAQRELFTADDFSPVFGTTYIAIPNADLQLRKYRWYLAIIDIEKQVVVSEHVLLPQYSYTYINLGTNAVYDDSVVLSTQSTESATNYDSSLIVYDLQTGESTILYHTTSDNMYNPALSHNGEWIVYSTKSGIYRISAIRESSEPELLLDHTDAIGPSTRDYWPNSPSWSPDDEWIVYHKCKNGMNCAEKSYVQIYDYAIYKLNVETKEETLIIENGINPFWRNQSSSDTAIPNMKQKE